MKKVIILFLLINISTPYGDTVTNVTTSIKTSNHNNIPQSIKLLKNYPNPFNPETQIVFSLPTEMTVKLKIFNIRGELINRFQAGKLPAGKNRIKWNGENKLGNLVGSGLYLYRLYAGGLILFGKMMLLR